MRARAVRVRIGPLEASDAHWFAALVAIGLLIRLVLVAEAPGNSFDTESFQLVTTALRDAPLDVYTLVNAPGRFPHWPYASGYFPWLWLVDHLAQLTGHGIDRLVRLPEVLADMAIAATLWLGARQVNPAKALAAAALVLLGPSFVANSSAHGQIDAMAACYSLLAVVLWQRDVARRWLVCGALVGLAAATKTPLGLLVLALLPTARDRGEGLRTAVVAVAVPVILLVPWLLHDPHTVTDAFRYRGLPGIGGLSLLAQPRLALGWLSGVGVEYSGLTKALQDLSTVLLAGGLVAAFTVLWRHRVPAGTGACLIVLVLWLLGVNFSLGYAVWGLPFLLLTGRLREAAAIQGLLLIPIVMIYTLEAVDGWPVGIVYAAFVPCMLGVLAFAGALLVHLSPWTAARV